MAYTARKMPRTQVDVLQANQSALLRTAKNSVSGVAAAVTVVMVGHPFDTLKVRLQTQPTARPVYTGLADCFIKTLKWEGIGGLYKGVGSPLVGQMGFRATLFASYYQIGRWWAGPERQGQRLKSHEYFAVGGLTGIVAGLVESPIDLFKTQMQIQIIRAKSGAEVQYRHVFHAGHMIIKQFGIRGAYQGLGATWLRDLPSFAAFFGFYELCRTYFIPQGGTVQDLSVSHTFVAGAVGGVLYWTLTYPTDVIKSAMQSDETCKANRKYPTIWACAKTLYHEEGGWTRFYRGFTPCLLRAVPVNAAQFAVLEQCRKWLS